MGSKLKVLDQASLDNISDFFSDIIEKKILASVKSQKEILSMDVNINVLYNDENKELDVDVDVDIETDELSKLSNERIDELIEEAYEDLDEYINDNFRE